MSSSIARRTARCCGAFPCCRKLSRSQILRLRGLRVDPHSRSQRNPCYGTRIPAHRMGEAVSEQLLIEVNPPRHTRRRSRICWRSAASLTLSAEARRPVSLRSLHRRRSRRGLGAGSIIVS